MREVWGFTWRGLLGMRERRGVLGLRDWSFEGWEVRAALRSTELL